MPGRPLAIWSGLMKVGLVPPADPPNKALLPRVLRLLPPLQSGKGEYNRYLGQRAERSTPMGPLGEVPVVQPNLATNAVAVPCGARARQHWYGGGAVVPGGVVRLVPPVIPFTTGKKVGVAGGIAPKR